MKSNLITCPDCQSAISVDAESCPSCGRVSDFIHPVFQEVLKHIEKLNTSVEYEIRGNEMILNDVSVNLRQKIGLFCLFISLVILVLSVVTPVLYGILGLPLSLGMLLTLGGLSMFTRQRLHLDLRKPGCVIGSHDQSFWAEILNIVRTEPNSSNIALGKGTESAQTAKVSLGTHREEKFIEDSRSSVRARQETKVQPTETSDDESVLQYWFRSPLQSAITIVGFGSMFWVVSEIFFDTDMDKVVSCWERIIAADPRSAGANDARQAIREINNSNSFELLTKHSKNYPGTGTLVVYEYRVNGRLRNAMCF